MKKRESAPAGWYYDPAFRFTQRFWDGETWTDRVASGTTELNDPLGVKKISVHYSPAGVFSETPTGWRGREVNKNDSSWLTSSESEAIRKGESGVGPKFGRLTSSESEAIRQELREAKEQRERSLAPIFWPWACIGGSLSLLLSLTSGRVFGESYADGNFAPHRVAIALVLSTVCWGVFFGGLMAVVVVPLVRKRRKGKG
ncbi:MAG: hypothetical protein JW395_1982 [Nitrospira sp.]|nr:hypothetical protein [Nitrospira sp.]